MFRRITRLIMKSAFGADKSDMASFDNVENARNNKLYCHDDSMVDSTKDYILMHLNGNYFLIARNVSWKVKLDDEEVKLYEKLGNQAFEAIAANRNQFGQ